MSRLPLVFLGLVSGLVFAPQVAGAQVSVSCYMTVTVCVSTVNGQDCHTDRVPMSCPTSGASHLKMATSPERMVRKGRVKEGSVCVVTRHDSHHDVSVQGKVRNGMCELDHPFP